MRLATTWIVLADGAKARVLAYQGPKNPLAEVEELAHRNQPTRTLVSDDRGRSHNRVGDGRAAMEHPTAPHRYEKEIFAREIAGFLENRLEDYDRLVLAAAPQTLGDLRQVLPPQVEARIGGELDKDLTSVSLPELPAHLQGVLNIEPHPRTLPANTPYAKL